MKPTFILLLTICLAVMTVNAQKEAIKVPSEVQPFVDNGTIPITLESADLNGDGLQDYILILERPDFTAAKYGYDVQQRPLLILVRGKDNKLSEVKRNEQIVYCSDCGGVMGDPFMGVTVGKNTFTVNHYGGSAWRWELSYKFNFSRIDKTWQLVQIKKANFHAADEKNTMEREIKTPKDFGKVDLADFKTSLFEESSETVKPAENTADYQKIDFSAFNREIEKALLTNEIWVKMPTRIIARMHKEFSEIRSRTIEMTAPNAEETDSLTIIVTDDGFLDDSVRGEKYKFELKKSEQGGWKFVSAGKSWRCWEGRGHQDFSTVKCS